MVWKLAEAKNQLSEVITRVLLDGPQEISRRKDRVVIISMEEYLQLKKPPLDFKIFLLQSTPDLAGIVFVRDQSAMRDVDL